MRILPSAERSSPPWHLSGRLSWATRPWLGSLLATWLLSGCGAQEPPLALPPVLSGHAPPGPGATSSNLPQRGDAPSTARCELSPLPSPSSTPATHTWTLTPQDTTIDVGQGEHYQGCTYNGQLPGPILHVREGDSVQLRLIHPAAPSSTPGSSGPSPLPPSRRHSLSVHGSGLGDDEHTRSIGPGEQLDLHFTASVPGVFLYHSVTPMALERVADGLYGAMVVEPREGWPTHADHSFVLVQSELYARPASPSPQRPGPPAARGRLRLDPVAVRTGQVSYMLHNGCIFGDARTPWRARAGQRIRLFLLNAGPNHAASLGVEGLVFDRIYAGGHPANLQRGLALVHLPPGSGAVAEVVVPARGYFTIADHSMRQAVEGASSQLAAVPLDEETAKAASPPQALPTHAIPPSGSPLRRGFDVYTRRCALCHSHRAGTQVGWEGPPLETVARKRTRQQILAWLDDPEQLVAHDPDARKLRARYRYTMPAQRSLRHVERAALLDYLAWLARR